MPPGDTVAGLSAFEGRSACTDAERRAAIWLRDRLRASGRPARLEPVWTRPHLALALALDCLVAVAGSVVAVWLPGLGLGLVALALVSLVGDLTGRFALLRLLTPQRATQNVVSPAPADGGRVLLVIAASIDAPRTGAARSEPWGRLGPRLRRALAGRLPSAGLAMALGFVVLAATAGARVAGEEGQVLGAIQFVPTATAIMAVAILLDIALSPASPGANANSSAAAVALELAATLDRRPPRHLAVEVVLAGAGEAGALGMRAYVRSRRRERRPEEVAVLAITPAGGGSPRWWMRDGPLLAVRLHPRLVELARRGAAGEHLTARGHAGHGVTPAYPARQARWPALAIGCLDDDGLAPRARTAADVPGRVDPQAMDAALELGLAIVARLDAELGLTAGRARDAEAATA
jgi:hypothetical protein